MSQSPDCSWSATRMGDHATILHKRREAAQRADTIRLQQIIEPGAVGGKLRAVSFPVPQMQHAGGKTPVLAPHAGMEKTDCKIGVFQAPAIETGIKAVDAVEVGARDGQIAS